MRLKLISAALPVWFWAALVLLALGPLRAVAAPPLKLEVQLVWGTNDKVSPDPKHKPVEPTVKRKLKELPLRWANYFEVNRQDFEVPADGVKKVSLSKQCAIEVKNLGHSKVEVSHFGKGEHVLKRTQALPKGETFVLGGNAPNATSWFVILKRIE